MFRYWSRGGGVIDMARHFGVATMNAGDVIDTADIKAAA